MSSEANTMYPKWRSIGVSSPFAADISAWLLEQVTGNLFAIGSRNRLTARGN